MNRAEPRSAAWYAGLCDRSITIACLLCPLFLTHGRGLAEAMIDATALLLLLRSALTADWDWLHRPWVTLAGLWWAWLCLCSVPFGPFGAGGWPGLSQALAVMRFLLFVAALQHVALRTPHARSAMRWLLVGCCLYVAIQLLVQAITGHNLFGMPRFHDGTLTGPYDKPRAAAPLSRLLLPVVLAASAWLAVRKPYLLASTLFAVAPPLAGLAVMVLAGQRMPLALSVLGLVVGGLLLPRLRPVLLASLLAVPLLVAASALLSPHSFAHLVILFGHQMRHFGQSPYGLIYTRAVAIASANPLTGLGFDGFRNGCPDPTYFHSWPPWGDGNGDGGGAAICVQHAHNHLLQAVTDAGVPGLLLFVAMVAGWLWTLGAPLLRPRPDLGPAMHGWRVGLFAAAFIQEWPIASASAFTNLPLGGWFFLLLGVGLADAHIERQHDPLRSPIAHV